MTSWSSRRARGPGGVAALLLAFGLGACALIPQEPPLYSKLVDDDVRLAAATVQHALENARDGEARRWSNRATGHAGTVMPVRTVVTEQGVFCRDYQEELRVADEVAVYRHRACRDERGRWVWI